MGYDTEGFSCIDEASVINKAAHREKRGAAVFHHPFQEGPERFNTGSHNVFTLELILGRAAGHFESFEDAEALIQAADESMDTQKKEKKTLRA